MDQQKIMQIQMIEQENQHLNQQLQLIEQNIVELQELNESMQEIESGDKQELLVNIGKRIYLPVKITEKKLLVEVGNKNFVKKSIPETTEVITEQIKRLLEGKEQVTERLNILQKEVEMLIRNVEAEQKKEQKKPASKKKN
ncbi:prefoldin subunit alpha [Candidatus Pacearchaeota archaeon]|nr:prefoldin subunit alpha [Candidatus Pacearchaeota archaeon]